MKTKSANLLLFSLNLAHQVNKESKEKPTLDQKYTQKTLYTLTASAEFRIKQKSHHIPKQKSTCTLSQYNKTHDIVSKLKQNGIKHLLPYTNKHEIVQT